MVKSFHGTYNGYQHHKCRCELCKGANTEYHRAYRATSKGSLISRRAIRRKYLLEKKASEYLRVNNPDAWTNLCVEVDAELAKFR